MINKNLKKKINKSPREPGVYIFRDSNNTVLYIGKAIKLRVRLRSYIDENILNAQPKVKKMISEAQNVDWVLTDTELEALVLESNLIKKYKPIYNVDLKDDKAYKYVKIRKGTGYTKDSSSYTISTTRQKAGKASYFGPYPSSKAINIVLKDLRKLFPYRNCTETKFKRYKKLKRPCLYGHIGLCPAPCQSTDAETENNKNIEIIKKFLRGNYKTILKNLKKQMKEYSDNMEYEKALEVRNKLDFYNYLSQKYKSSQELIKKVNIAEGHQRSLHALVSFLSYYFESYRDVFNSDDYLEKLNNFRIEFFDISNTGKDIIVGSMITLTGGSFDKKLYRKFKIRNQTKQDDYKSMQQMVERRLNHLKDWGRPDLAVVDGGKGQLSSVYDSLKKADINVIGLAKKDETIIIKKDGKFNSVNLPKNDLALKLLIKGRDEVHRFGIGYNRSLRSFKQK